MGLRIDEMAKAIALQSWTLPECLHVPIAAVDEDAIRNYVGDVEPVVVGRAPHKALLVLVQNPLKIDPLLPINDHPNSRILHAGRQVWVHIGFTRYRDAYRKAIPEEDIKGRVLSHAINRRTAALKGFEYVRITPVSRAGNSSSSFSEKWAVELHGSARAIENRRLRPPHIQYGDLCDLMLMLDMRLGGGVMEAVNAGQKLVERRR
jgi:hypothetical protein